MKSVAPLIGLPEAAKVAVSENWDSRDVARFCHKRTTRYLKRSYQQEGNTRVSTSIVKSDPA